MEGFPRFLYSELRHSRSQIPPEEVAGANRSSTLPRREEQPVALADEIPQVFCGFGAEVNDAICSVGLEVLDDSAALNLYAHLSLIRTHELGANLRIPTGSGGNDITPFRTLFG